MVTRPGGAVIIEIDGDLGGIDYLEASRIACLIMRSVKWSDAAKHALSSSESRCVSDV